MSDVLGNLGDSLVTALGDQFKFLAIGDAEWPISVEHCEDPEIDLADEQLRGPLLWVVDWSEVLDAESGHAGVMTYEEEGLLVILQMKIFQQGDQQQGAKSWALLRALGGLMADVARFCRPLDEPRYLAAGDDLFCCVKATRKQARDRQDWHEKRLFYGDLLTEWRRY